MKSGRDGTVIIPQEDIDTFLDYRLPLAERLARLATFLRSDAWSASKFAQASDLLCEVADRLASLKTEDNERLNLFRHMDHKIRSLEDTINRLMTERAVLEMELSHLRDANY